MQLPNVWGEGGQLFAYSGMDGETSWRNPLVGSTLGKGSRGFVFHAPGEPKVRFGVKVNGKEYLGDEESPFTAVEDDLVSGCAVVSHITAGGTRVKLEYAFADKFTLLARVTADEIALPLDVFIEGIIQGADGEAAGTGLLQCVDGACYSLASSSPSAHVDTKDSRVYAALAKPGDSVTFAWVYSPTGPKQAAALTNQALSYNIDQAISNQISYLGSLPKPSASNPDLQRTYYKAASVLKTNCYSPEGEIPFRWTTPDRWPHRHMWIWDSAFHAIGLRHISGEWAEDAIKAVLARQRENGFIPHTMMPGPNGESGIIQPPILAWASWKVYQKTGNKDFLAYIYPRIGRMVDCDCDVRDFDKNGLAEWEGGFASGMDNSPRFDQPVGDAVDLNSYIVNDMRHLAKIARELDKLDEAAEWDRKAQERADLINARLWDQETGFYYDAAPDGSIIKIKTEAGFTPLLAGIPDKPRAEELIKHLTDPAEFWRSLPVSSVSADEPAFSDNMWRGPVWINMNYFFVEALKNYGHIEAASHLRQRTLEEISHWYNTDGIIYEFYDSEARTEPIFLHRKKLGGPQAQRSAVSLGTNVCDYNWTAALYVDLMLEAN